MSNIINKKLKEANEALSNNNTSKADEQLKQIQKVLDEYYAEMIYCRAVIALREDRYYDAIKHFDKALKLNPENPEYIKPIKELDDLLKFVTRQLKDKKYD